MKKEEREQVEKMALELGTYIPPDISINAWPIPILEALIERINVLQSEVDARYKP
jgi:hypothetical protein